MAGDERTVVLPKEAPPVPVDALVEDRPPRDCGVEEPVPVWGNGGGNGGCVPEPAPVTMRDPCGDPDDPEELFEELLDAKEASSDML